MEKKHQYQATVEWTGNLGSGTFNYTSYKRDHLIQAPGRPAIECSSDSAFRGDAKRYNPEELLLSSVSSCHMLWYLHLCAEAGIIVLEYRDEASGLMLENSDGSGAFKEIVLKPKVKVANADMLGKAEELHKKANEFCFIARSLNFPVRHEPEILV
ncbi:OsmC family protein [Pedobacter deserti]|uniref:OsmC family protein n=1 Tax=Pedobacter deserti TaxID=2817382 RepID=UPI00210E33DE|nr:OsmC family protein [Pedobacter sp. SYSU D00382]